MELFKKKKKKMYGEENFLLELVEPIKNDRIKSTYLPPERIAKETNL